MKKYFKMYSNCVPIKGFKRSLICDTQKYDFDFIPNSLFEILENEIDTLSINEITLKHKEFKETILEYFDFLVKKNYGFLTKEPSRFGKLKHEKKLPNKVTNAIIDHDKDTNHDYKKIFSQLSELLCITVELRFFNNVNIEKLISILNHVNDLTIRTISILIPFDFSFSKTKIEKLILNYSKITSIIFHSYAHQPYHETLLNVSLTYTTEQILSEHCCGQVSSDYFIPLLPMITESLVNNSCLNKKISIDKKGEVRNCPSMKNSFGNHKNILLEDVIKLQEFKLVWEITKDQIEICKDCEFRYICQDCRAYTIDENNKYSKPLKCKYDPYEAVWN